MTPEELKEIENRCNKATPGPWILIPPDDTTPHWYVSRRLGEVEGFYISCMFNGKDDAVFVALSRETIPKLLEYIKELESKISRWIPVEERLPEETVVVIVCSKNLGVIPGAFHKDGRWYWDLGIMKDVTHWQPFPKGPEE